MNGCPNNQLPLESCNPNSQSAFAVIPSYGGSGYACNTGPSPQFGSAGNSYAGGATLAGYSTLGNYLGVGSCCNPQVQGLCQSIQLPRSQNKPRPSPRPSPRPK